MRTLLLVLVIIAIPVVIGMFVVQRGRRTRHQAQPIEPGEQVQPPGPAVTESMIDPPPGSQADRERHGKP